MSSGPSGPMFIGLSLYTKDLYLVIALNLIILHDEKREKHAFHTKDHLQGIVTLCFCFVFDMRRHLNRRNAIRSEDMTCTCHYRIYLNK